MARDERSFVERVRDELTPVDMEARFNDMLDECYSFESVGGPFAHMQASRVLLECDPVAHRCGVNDYADSERDVLEEVDGDYYEIAEVDKIREEMEAEAEETDDGD